MQYEPVILVIRGDELPKRNYRKKLHPTYETSIRVKNSGGQQITPHCTIKFYDQYRTLCETLHTLGIGQGMPINIDAPFPPKFPKSFVGFKLTEEQLQRRCYMLNKWMCAIFNNYPYFPTKAQLIISEFLSLNDNDTLLEQNKELILQMLRTRKNNPTNITDGITAFTRSGQTSVDNGVDTVNNETSTVASQLTRKSSRLTSSALAQINKEASDAALKSQQHIDVSSYSSSSNIISHVAAENHIATTSGHSNSVVSPDDSPDNDKKYRSGKSFSAHDTNRTLALTPIEIEEYSKEVVIHNFLGATVLKGDKIKKRSDEQKYHPAYEIILRLLPLEAVHLDLDNSYSSSYNNNNSNTSISSASLLAAVTASPGSGGSNHVVALTKNSIDPVAYELQRKLPTIVIARVFGAFRTLKQDLELVHVYSADNVVQASNARHAGFKVIVIDAPFPRTLTRSALGIGLTDHHVKMRAALLNNWLGLLLKAFVLLPRDGKELVVDFLGLPSTYREGDVSPQYILVHSLLRNTYQPPMLLLPANESEGNKLKKQERQNIFTSLLNSITTSRGTRSNSIDSSSDPIPMNSKYDTTVDNNNIINNSGENTPPLSPTNSKQQQQQQSLVHLTSSFPSTSASINSTMLLECGSVISGSETVFECDINEMALEAVVNTYLGVCITRGQPVAKIAGEKRTHPSYEVTLRLLTIDELNLPNKESIDEEAYMKQYLQHGGPVRVSRVFDEYRSLKEELEAEFVYSKGSKQAALLARDQGHAVILIDATFPRTYRRSSIGIKLSEDMLQLRSVMLNNWFGALLQAFSAMSPGARRMVIDFLQISLNNNNNSSSNNAAIDGTVADISVIGSNNDDNATMANPPAIDPSGALMLSILRNTFVPEFRKLVILLAPEIEEEKQRRRRVIAEIDKANTSSAGTALSSLFRRVKYGNKFRSKQRRHSSDNHNRIDEVAEEEEGPDDASGGGGITNNSGGDDEEGADVDDDSSSSDSVVAKQEETIDNPSNAGRKGQRKYWFKKGNRLNDNSKTKKKNSYNNSNPVSGEVSTNSVTAVEDDAGCNVGCMSDGTLCIIM